MLYHLHMHRALQCPKHFHTHYNTSMHIFSPVVFVSILRDMSSNKATIKGLGSGLCTRPASATWKLSTLES